MKKVWLLDPGHGGLDENGKYVTPGKRSPEWPDGSQYFEGVGNRDIVKKIAEGAKRMGIETKFIVEPNDHRDISLPARVDLANRLYKTIKNAVYVSIHSNGFNKPEAHGWSVYTSKGETMSDVFATHLFTECMAQYPDAYHRKDTRDGDPDKEANFYVLKYTHMPAILSENFFMTNPKECKEILMTEEGRQKIADMHLNWMKFIDEHPTI